jgi:peptide/nickel transport system ATP-binding protein
LSAPGEQAEGTLLKVEGLSVDIATDDGPLHAVDDVGFALNGGETLCLVGESGCGKSLTALALMGLLPRRATRTAKYLRFEGQDLQSVKARALERLRGNRMAMIFQEPMTSLNPAFTVGQLLTDVLHSHVKVSAKQAEERAVFLLEKVGISAPASRLSQYPHQLSGGLRQRVMIAMALMCGPSLILADEPTTALDVTLQAELLHLLAELQREFGMGMILITHDLGIVSRIADRVCVMYAGQVVESGTSERIFTSPCHPYTQALMLCLPQPGRQRMQRLPSIAGTVPSLVGDLRGCHFRDRCPHAGEICGETIELREAEFTSGHVYRCVLPPVLPPGLAVSGTR